LALLLGPLLYRNHPDYFYSFKYILGIVCNEDRDCEFLIYHFYGMNVPEYMGCDAYQYCVLGYTVIPVSSWVGYWTVTVTILHTLVWLSIAVKLVENLVN